MSLSLGLSLALRGSGPPAYTPASASVTARTWIRADSGVTLAGAKVSQINDQIGIMHQVQGTDASRPTFTASDAAYGSRPVMTFVTQFFSAVTTVASLAGPISVLIVGDASTGTRSFYSTDDAPNNLLWRTGTNLELFGNGGATMTSSGGEGAAGPGAILFTDDGTGGGSAANLYRNNLSVPIVSSTTKWGSCTSMNLGKTDAGVGSMQGRIAEWIIWSGILSAADRIALAAYLSARYGIAVTAP